MFGLSQTFIQHNKMGKEFISVGETITINKYQEIHLMKEKENIITFFVDLQEDVLVSVFKQSLFALIRENEYLQYAFSKEKGVFKVSNIEKMVSIKCFKNMEEAKGYEITDLGEDTLHIVLYYLEGESEKILKGFICAGNHAFYDGISFSVLLDSVILNYHQFKETGDAYHLANSSEKMNARFVSYFTSTRYKKDLKYWQNLVKEDIRTARFVHGINRNKVERVRWTLETTYQKQMEEFCEKNNVSEAISYFSIFAYTMQPYYDTQDYFMNTVIHNRMKKTMMSMGV